MALRRRARRLTDHEVAALQEAALLQGLAVDRLQELACGELAELGEVRIDRRQRWPARFRHDVPVVEADERDVIGDAPPRLAQGIADASADLNEHLVLCDDDLAARNTPGQPDRVVPRSRSGARLDGALLRAELPPRSWNVLRLAGAPGGSRGDR
jgi:hypothetical protein